MSVASVLSSSLSPSQTLCLTFIPTTLEALNFVWLCLTKQLPLCAPGPLRDGSSIASGSMYLYKGDANTISWGNDRSSWIFVDIDGPFIISRLADFSLHKKEIILEVGNVRYKLVSYSSQWDTVNGALKLPSYHLGSFQPFSYNFSQDLSSKERFRKMMEVSAAPPSREILTRLRV